MDRGSIEPSVAALSDSNARRWVDYHHEVAAPSEYSHEFVWDVTAEAAGPFVTDVDGNVFLDFTCHIGAAPLGYNNPKILDKLDAFDLVDPMKIAGQDLYFGTGDDPEATELPGSSQLMHRLRDVSAQYGMDTVFLSNSGAEAIENAMKISYANTANPKYAVTFTGAFHGRTLGTLSFTRSGDTYTRKYPEVAGTRTLPYCACEGDCHCGFFRDGSSALRDLFEGPAKHLDPSEVAFVVLEPVQGVGGYHFASDRFLREVDAVAEEYGLHVVVDEIQSGVGRTGEMWAVDHTSLAPDVIASAKALRVGATISRSDVFPSEPNRIGSTWGAGDILASMQGAFTLDAIEEHGLLDNATERGRQFIETFDAERDAVADVRGRGLMLAVEFDTPERRDAVVKACLERGMLTIGCGHSTLRLLPPLDATEREIELGASILSEAVDAA
ncbi:class-III pyridoxal-phosphate-dependent aminotransferase [Halocalculus aciditolerans]|uniref:class-III pyridoxal-phosphate-dependent aminotransferase n=1 Tax=Halocalculus aciditolerans TaxID=1383812 RepID=UPI00166825AC|nr:aminotransferase class III-fold pyridoxal phosphate-dependent enzyme [Halocalculus aciditolerans]